MTLGAKAPSHLLKARELSGLLRVQRQYGLRSNSLALAQDAAEHAFRAILFARGVARQGDHRPDEKALENKDVLADLWSDLAPQISEYAWLWRWRNRARYAHTDAPPLSDPAIAEGAVDRAQSCVQQLIDVAERAIGHASR